MNDKLTLTNQRCSYCLSPSQSIQQSPMCLFAILWWRHHWYLLSKLCCMVCTRSKKVAPPWRHVAPPVLYNMSFGWRHLEENCYMRFSRSHIFRYSLKFLYHDVLHILLFTGEIFDITLSSYELNQLWFEASI